MNDMRIRGRDVPSKDRIISARATIILGWQL